MKLSPESLEAFMQAAAQGSFSAAARRLGKSQSTVSEAVARLEIDLGVNLFDRSGKAPMLTDAGRALLPRVEDVLGASDRLQLAAGALAGGLEARLTLVMSDAYQSPDYKTRMTRLAERFPELELECVFAEHADVINLISSGRAALGLLPATGPHPPEIGSATVAERAEFAIFVAATHPLATTAQLSLDELGQWRSLRLNTLHETGARLDDVPKSRVRSWSAPNYLILLDLAVLGFGWAALPRWLVNSYAAERLVELQIPGWPRHQALEVIWSRERPLGPAGSWLRDALLNTELNAEEL
ncbi:DNA-binding transcriptional regulator, LysR family [Halopseudomonas sabulinigri]|uniref:DNA-binding transcriptional regulator, LysR family n=1 Tax=Halopseudomonas sabulinigri TaxID=472181 RepID=A0A1H1MC85_9GAMM|nr:LysR family transcriptional regulator [Halopseudomonas sabulinigri]SDR84421.1 DNA-binding transcriptional regulator, LysR family [Halopseudomonas sabulinigri]